MLSGSAVLRVGILIVVAAVLAGIIQMLRPQDSGTPETPITRTAPETGAAGTQAAVPPAATRPVSPVAPAPLPQAVPAPAPQAAVPPTPAPAPNAPLPVPAPTAPSPHSPAPSDPAPALPDLGTASRPTPPSAGEEAIDTAAETAGPRGVAIVDLNTGTVAELNGLRGGGMIGRAIVQKRPYASVGELLSKRVLSRAVYERIKDQVTVR
ncbi:hypothetical protein ASG51_10790 [Methylobacterium sp. Leaf465]|uniref:helix-hairpin-helix domain-containing protein n=1 Tax=unclassified Methylobacterium TaxID=2615210 RepID=UPI000700CE83|nr:MULTISPECIES: helix-hairpin-helix domain-containing protein [unclassified Methylobacterium]KQT71416.1 hypothetical protein ASG51_10790 [Methylobacterium sp. Leaf465]KQU34126.1 hypothetical protein ASG63_13920 [Methylobacterium sp. Leaf94]